MGDNQNELDGKVKAIRQLLDMFKIERMVYLGITILCLLVLLGCAFYLLFGKGEIAAVIGMFSASGGVTYTCGRLLKMWSDAMQLLSSIKKEE
jgi:hypothetical protein